MTDNIRFVRTETIETPIGAMKTVVVSDGNIAVASFEMPKQIENGMSIEQSNAILINTTPKSTSLSIKINCELQRSSLKGTHATGQYLDCIEWLSEQWHVTIGTEDTESLEIRYPGVDITDTPYPVKYHDSGLSIDLKFLNIRQSISLHVIFSSKRLPDEQECTAWFFAGRPHNTVEKAFALS